MAKLSLGLRLDEGLIQALDTWRERQPVSPTRTAVVEQALREFLERNRTEENEDA